MNNFILIVNKDNLVKCNALINSLLQVANAELNFFTIHFDEISRLLLGKIKHRNINLIPIAKIENKFKNVPNSFFDISKSNNLLELQKLYPLIISYLNEEKNIDSFIFLKESIYFFNSPDYIFSLLANTNENFTISHLGKILFTKIIYDEIYIKKYIENILIERKDIYYGINLFLASIVKSFEVSVYNSENNILIYDFSDLEFLSQYIIIPSYSYNKYLNDYEATEIYAPYIDQLYISLSIIRNHLSDFSEGLFNDLDIGEMHSFIALSSVIDDIDTKTLQLSTQRLNEYLYYFKPKYAIENEKINQSKANINSKDSIETAQAYDAFTINNLHKETEINNKKENIKMEDPISFELKFNDFTKSDNSNLDQNRINSQIENLNIKLHNENTIKAEKENLNIPENKNESESDEEYLLDLLNNNKFEIINFDLENDEHSDYYDINFSVRINRKKDFTAQNQTENKQVAINEEFISKEDPRLFNCTPAKEAQANIIWEGTQFVYHSLALINREISYDIIKSEVAELTIVPYEDDKFFDIENPKYLQLAQHDIRYKNFDAINDTTKSLPYAWIRHQWPPQDEAPKGAKWIIMQPWEYSSLPIKFVEIFKKADEIWTPSNFCRKAFISSGLDFNKVQVIPNGIDPESFTPSGNKLPINSFKKFKFLFIGGTIYRKGIDILLEAYSQAFTSDDEVCLIIKDMGGDSFYNGQTAKEKILEIQNKPNSPEIIYIDSYLSEEEMSELYRSADVFVSPYRGEGFSLPTLEAMASGLPVIVTKDGATDDFVDESVGWQITSTKISVGNKIDNYEMVNDTELLEPDKIELSETMRLVATNPQYNFSKGVYATLRARKQCNWKRSTIKMFSRLDYLLNTTMASKAEINIPDYSDSSLEFAIALQKFDNGLKDEAFKIWDSIISNNDLPLKYKLHIYHIKAYDNFINDNYELALNLLDEAIVDVYEHPDNNYLRALIYAKQDKYEEVYEILTYLYEKWSYIKSDSTLGLALDDLLILNADTAFLQKDVEIAFELYSQALKFNNNSAGACYGSAQCLKELGDVDGAKNMLNWAIKLNPNFEEAKIEFEKIN